MERSQLGGGGDKRHPCAEMPDTPNRLPRTLGPQPSWYSAVEGPEMQASNESTVTPRTATTRRQYPAPEAWTEWSSERRDHLEIRDPRRFRPRTISDKDAGSTLSKLPELPTPQREGLKLIDRSRGYEYTLTTHIVPAAWPRSTPEIGCPAGCSPDGSRDRGAFRRVRKEMLDVEKRYLRGELPERRDEREYWFCVNRYVRNRLEESERKGRKRLTLYLAHAVGFGKEVSAAGCSTLSISVDIFVVLGTNTVTPTLEPRGRRPDYRRDMVMGRS